MSDASLVRETSTGGVAAYTILNDAEILSSLGRNQAIALIEKKCPQGYRILHEGAVPRVSKAVDKNWRGQVTNVYDGGIEERLWGLQFTCK